MLVETVIIPRRAQLARPRRGCPVNCETDRRSDGHKGARAQAGWSSLLRVGSVDRPGRCSLDRRDQGFAGRLSVPSTFFGRPEPLRRRIVLQGEPTFPHLFHLSGVFPAAGIYTSIVAPVSPPSQTLDRGGRRQAIDRLWISAFPDWSRVIRAPGPGDRAKPGHDPKSRPGGSTPAQADSDPSNPRPLERWQGQ
jgi:hypothetical protein